MTKSELIAKLADHYPQLVAKDAAVVHFGGAETNLNSTLTLSCWTLSCCWTKPYKEALYIRSLLVTCPGFHDR